MTAVMLGFLSVHATDVDIKLTPAPDGEVTNLATIKFTFDGLEMITQQNINKISATLTNETTGDRYVAVKVQYSYSEWNAATLSFGIEGSSTPVADISADGTYKLEVAAGSFKSEMVNPTYYSPAISKTYTIGGEPADEMSSYTLTPAAGNVTEIGTVRIAFPGTGWKGIKIVSTDGITLTYTSVNGVTTRVAKIVKTSCIGDTWCDMQFEWEDATVKEPMTFITPGTYVLDIPAGAFTMFFGGTAVNRHIVANYTIEQNGGVMSTPSVQPAPGEVTQISTVTLNFGNAAHLLEFADDLSAITITRKGELKTTWRCIGATASQYSATLTFARGNSDIPGTINSPGEYLLTIPAGMISGYTSGGRKFNDGLQYLYVIKQGVNNMTTWTISPETEEVAEIGNVQVTFPDVQDDILLPADYDGITLAYTPFGSETVETTSHPRGSQHQGKTVTLAFGSENGMPFTAPGTYALTIPQGTFREDGNSASFNTLIEKSFVIAPVEAAEVTLDATEKEVFVGETFTLVATVAPENTTDKTVMWSSSDENVVTVDSEGNVEAVGVGEATVTATCGSATGSCAVTVKPIEATEVTLDATEKEVLVGEIFTLVATVAPDNTTDKTVVWSSSDENVVTVDGEGNVEAVGVGEATVTATCGSTTGSCAVTVKPIEATEVIVEPSEIVAVEGETVQLTATVLPDNTTDKTVVWTSGDETVATVDENGLVTILKAGECDITATCGNAAGICHVKGTSGIAGVTAEGAGLITYVSPDCLEVTGVEGAYTLCVYGVDGICRAIFDLEGRARVSVAGLLPGVYVARVAGVAATRFAR